MLDYENKLLPEEDRPVKILLADIEADNEWDNNSVTSAIEAKVIDDIFELV